MEEEKGDGAMKGQERSERVRGKDKVRLGFGGEAGEGWQ